jgi:hypothetical protein
MEITISDIREYQRRMEIVKANGFKAGDYKALGRELVDKFDLTAREAIAILGNKGDEILKILEKVEVDG